MASLTRFLTWSALLSAAGILALACSKEPKAKKPTTPIEIATERMLRSEANLLSWGKTHRLSAMADAAQSMEFPGEMARKYFADTFTVVPIVDESPEYDEILNEGTAGIRHWHPAENAVTVYAGNGAVPAGAVDFADFRMYESLFSQVEYFDSAKFKIYIPVPEWVDPATMHQWKVHLLFTGKGLMKNGRLGQFKGLNEVVWEMDPESYDEVNPDEQVWKIVSWKAESLKITETDGWLFEEVLDEVIPDAASLELARQSIHENYVRGFLQAHKDGDPKSFKKPYPYWQIAAGERHPTVVVCDYNQDGWDDFYAQERHGRNLFFRNNGDGTFDEIGQEIGLAFGEEGKTSSTVFADLDNDGDEDAVVGGTLVRTRIMENVDGKFVDRSQDWIDNQFLPFNVSSLNAVDYDNDGLLDIYCTTYASFFIQKAMTAIRSSMRDDTEMADVSDFVLNGLEPFMLPEDWAVLEPMIHEAAAVAGVHTNRPGPPNFMLHNLGDGRFEPADIAELRDFHNTFQATWADFDNDGDPDVYLANDFAPNFMKRNNGDGTFTDITEQLQVADIGFGMGVTWGDYDNDGLQDMYVTNMFSKAARRVTSFFTEGRANFDASLLGAEGGIDPVFEQLGRGNSLFHNNGDQAWTKVSGMERPSMLVEQGGWAWGAQFADFNNDGWLDIYNPSGYYTAPKDKRRDVDL